MNKAELVEAIVESSGKTKADVTMILDHLMTTITDVLKSGDQVGLTGFGSFSTVNRPARNGRNPQTGKPMEIKASRVAKFKVGKLLKEAVQEA